MHRDVDGRILGRLIEGDVTAKIVAIDRCEEANLVGICVKNGQVVWLGAVYSFEMER